MSWRPFETRVPGKWVLAGEHAVLRGQMAVALPHPERGLSLSFELGDSDLEVAPSEAAPVIQGMLGAVPELAGRMPRGKLSIASSLPVGAGLGSSAALCAAVTRWLAGPLQLAREQWPEFATRLEDRFHGKSSGMDVAAILAGGPVRFTRSQVPVPILAPGTGSAIRLPRFTFHDTGLRASTRSCIAQVEGLALANSEESRRLDELMGQASRRAAEGLEHCASTDGAEAGLRALAQAMELSTQCFEAWGLLPPQAKALMQELKTQGALATKLTGAGSGGFVVALWADSTY